MESIIPTHSQVSIVNNKVVAISAVSIPFRILTVTLHSLLLPLSFLLLARLSTAHYLISVSDNYPIPTPPSFTSSIFLHTKYLSILHILVSVITVSTLTNLLTGKITFLVTPIRLLFAWVFLFVFQFSVCFGIEGSIVAGIDGSGFGEELSFVSRMVFFFGLHETMRFWGKTIVRPVVDDTIFGFSIPESLAEKVLVGMCYGGLWWWRLREEVEALVVVAEVKRDLMMGVGVTDLVGWWLYYVTVTIGIVKVVKGLVSLVTKFMSRRTKLAVVENDEKV